MKTIINILLVFALTSFSFQLFAKTKKNKRASALVSRSASSKKKSARKSRLLNWQDYKKMNSAQRSALIASLKGVYKDIDAKSKKPGTTGSVQKFMSDWEAADAKLYEDNKRLITFDAYSMVASHFCEKQTTVSCTSFKKICRDNIK
jgi:hypothetical protein